MTFSFLKPVLLVTTLALAACSQGGLNGDDAGGAGGIGAGGIGAGGVGDPTSPAYFNEVVGDRVLFAVDQSTLSSEAQGVLAGQAQWLLSNPEFTALIEGHADEQGTREYNLALGARRAAAVREYLVSQGVPDSRLRTISYGKERPLQICSSEACYSQNRRAVTVISAGLGA
ncbi:peptidoglycan-associated lipoprotein [Jannaschia sp. EhC01]|uniref:Peptidoglycan-associated lipoprotein n=1 Tax=Gymnodinialimonas phycosphaerae TaxID=2841589 RepID=A0A975TUS0_9RHOB|nr:peptidoglycan-associated lipoprotein Pal [Gymnodinialimonas phycosphaerae]MBY4895017.1 peptidoglycan-associated lipoprotein Pal [Gymnodinialimonas phycosphaerae]OAN84362.1 peptidoglycan-associated lipoprotein [Jannaschia sp. EhC01]